MSSKHSCKELLADPEETTDAEELQEVEGELRAASARLERERRRGWLQFQEDTLQELWKAWSHRNFAEVHRLARRAAGCRVGIKRRSYLAVRTEAPTSDAWTQQWCKPGHEGGMLASLLGSWHDWRDSVTDVTTTAPLWEEARPAAQAGLDRLRHWVRRAPKRKAAPP